MNFFCLTGFLILQCQVVPAGEEQPDLSLKMNAGNVASVVTGPTNAKNPVVDAVAIAMEEEGEAAQEDAEADLRKYRTY